MNILRWKIQIIKTKKIEKKYLNNIQENQFLKVKNSLLELEKYFMELKGRELNDIEAQDKREIEELLFKLIIVSTENEELNRRIEDQLKTLDMIG